MTTSPIPAILGAAKRRVVEALLREGANRPDAARPLEGLSRVERRQLDRLLRQGMVQEVQPGTYYVVEPAWTAQRAIQRLTVMITLLVLWVVFLLAFLFW